MNYANTQQQCSVATDIAIEVFYFSGRKFNNTDQIKELQFSFMKESASILLHHAPNEVKKSFQRCSFMHKEKRLHHMEQEDQWTEYTACKASLQSAAN